jgi:hypothetical protein
MYYDLLPYMENEAVYELGMTTPFSSIANDSFYACAKIVPHFLCPTDASNDSNLQGNGMDGSTLSTINPPVPPHVAGDRAVTGICYAGNVMVFDPNPIEGITPGSSSGETGPAKGSLNEAMLDGTSNTITFAHRYKLCNSTTFGITNNLWWAPPRHSNGVKQTAGFGWGDYRRVQPAPFTMAPKGAFLSGVTSGASFTSGSQGGNAGTGIPFQVAPKINACQQNVTQSPHVGVTVVGLGDGSTRSVFANIATAIWHRACHPSDGIAQNAW